MKNCFSIISVNFILSTRHKAFPGTYLTCPNISKDTEKIPENLWKSSDATWYPMLFSLTLEVSMKENSITKTFL